MSKVFITGDCHARFDRFYTSIFPEQKELTKDDYVIICGDFGGVWDQEETKAEKYELDLLNNRNYTTLFIDGNHENFERLNKYPIKEWHGGRVHEIRPSVLHLMRGEIYEIAGKKFFAMGGANSHDIRDGILEPDDPRVKEWKHDLFKSYRINRVSWWEEEIPSFEEREYAIANLKEYNNKVDYVLTHEAPSSIVPMVGIFKPTEYSCWLENEIALKIQYDKWFFGHYHLENNIFGKFQCHYSDIERII